MNPEYLIGRIHSLLETPLAVDEGTDQTIDVAIAGQTFKVNAGSSAGSESSRINF